jgi:hypothetical protein
MNEKLMKVNRIKLTDKKKNQMRVVLHEQKRIHDKRRKERYNNFWSQFK